MNDEPETWSANDRIEAVFQAADRLEWSIHPEWKKTATKQLSDAIDEAMAHAHKEGYEQCKREWNAADLKAKTAAAMSTHTSDAITDIWNLTPRAA